MSLLCVSDAPVAHPVSTARRRRTLIPTAKQAALSFCIALALLLIDDTFVFESIQVPTSSMRPTILPNERVILRHFAMRPLGRFDVVVINEIATHKRIVKRIVGLPGERVRLEGGWKLFIDGQSLAYGELSPDGLRKEGAKHLIELARDARPPPTRFGKDDLLLGPDEYFVLGDSRLASSDSRVIGPVKRKDIQGTVWLVWYSFDLVAHRLRTGRMPHRVQ